MGLQRSDFKSAALFMAVKTGVRLGWETYR